LRTSEAANCAQTAVKVLILKTANSDSVVGQADAVMQTKRITDYCVM
jgi:hypothetical protein